MYEFICSQEETVKLFPILFRETIYNKLNDLHREIQALDNLKDSYKEYVFNRFTEFRTSLQKLIWSKLSDPYEITEFQAARIGIVLMI